MKKSILAALAALSMSGAWAQVYIGAGLSVTNASVNCSGLTKCATDDGGMKAYAGYVTKSGVGFEAQYLQIGDVETSNGTTNVAYHANGLVGAAVFRGTISRNFWVHAKLGMARIVTKSNARTSAVIYPETSESTTKPYFSVGAEYGFVENVKLSAFIDETKGKYSGGSAGIRMVGLGVEFLF